MKFEVGDTVVHWSHGLGQITGVEERNVTGERQVYYVLKIRDLNVWVPNDERLPSRMRKPTSRPAFKKLLSILSGPAKTLPDDRNERKTQLRSRMADGTTAAICHVIRDLTAREAGKPLNDDDKTTLQRARTMLLGEWEYSLRTPSDQAESDLLRILKSQPRRG